MERGMRIINEVQFFVRKRLNEIDHILIDRKGNASVLGVRSFRGADCYADQYLAVTKVRERLAISKQTTHTFHMENFNLKKLNDIGGKEQYPLVKRIGGRNSVSYVRQIDIHRAEPLLPEPSPEFEIAIAKWKNINNQVIIKFRQS
jgi:hypothetical protein